MNIYEKINKVMQDIEYLSKDDKVITNAITNAGYKVLSEEKVTSAVRQSLIKNGIVIIPIKQEHKRDDETVKGDYGDKTNRIATVDVTYRIQNIEDKEDYIDAVSSGTGIDTQDKGVGKAMTYAYKYLLLRTFAIPTGEDPDKISSDVYSDNLNKGDKQSKVKPVAISDEEYDKLFDEQNDLVTDKEVQILRKLLFAGTTEATNKNINGILAKYNKFKLEELLMTEYVEIIHYIEELKKKQKENMKGVL